LPSVLLWYSTLGKETSLPRAVYRTLGKVFFAECRGFAEYFLFGSRQSLLCRAPEKKTLGKASGAKRSAKPPALGKEADFDSELYKYRIAE
jgi:hypothetical protein